MECFQTENCPVRETGDRGSRPSHEMKTEDWSGRRMDLQECKETILVSYRKKGLIKFSPI
jgi:hypothetical protein